MAAEWHQFKTIAHGFIPCSQSSSTCSTALNQPLDIDCLLPAPIWSRRGFNAPGANLRSVLRLLASFALLTPVLFALPSPSYQVKRGKSMGTVIASPGQLSVSSPIIRSKSDPFKSAEALGLTW